MKRAEITALEAEFRRMFGESSPDEAPKPRRQEATSPSATETSEQTNGAHPPTPTGTISERFLALLASEPKKTFPPRGDHRRVARRGREEPPRDRGAARSRP